MKDIPPPHLLLKFQTKICKSLVTRTCPKFLYSQKMHAGPLGVKTLKKTKTEFIPRRTQGQNQQMAECQ